MKRLNGSKRVRRLARDFQGFALKESTFGTAVGIMIGVALKDVITSLIDNLLMPPIAYITSGINFSQLFVVIGKGKYESVELAKEAGKVVLTYGNFINAFVTFLITAIILFFLANILLKNIKKAVIKEEKKIREARKCPYCFSEIHDEATRCPSCTSELGNK